MVKSRRVSPSKYQHFQVTTRFIRRIAKHCQFHYHVLPSGQLNTVGCPFESKALSVHTMLHSAEGKALSIHTTFHSADSKALSVHTTFHPAEGEALSVHTTFHSADGNALSVPTTFHPAKGKALSIHTTFHPAEGKALSVHTTFPKLNSVKMAHKIHVADCFAPNFGCNALWALSWATLKL